jgi:hypothetical protein
LRAGKEVKMAVITRKELAGIDTDGDLTPDVVFSVIPEQPQSFNHPSGATYQIQVENRRSDVSIDLWKKVRDVQDNEEYERMNKTVGVGERITIESVTLTDTGPRHPQVSPLRVQQRVKYRIAIGNQRYPVEFVVEADCNDIGGEGSMFPKPSQGEYVLGSETRQQVLACANKLLELLG